MLKIFTPSDDQCQAIPTALDEIAREGARRLLTNALEIEVAEYINQHKDKQDITTS